MSEIPVACYEYRQKFCCGQNWRFYPELKEKEIYFCFDPTPEQKANWTQFGFKKLRHLLSYLEKQYGLNNFELYLFKDTMPKPYYIKQENSKNLVAVNFDRYVEYGNEINLAIEKLKVQEYAKKIMADYSKKVPEKFFKGDPPEALVSELRNSYYTVLEGLINEFDKMNDEEKSSLKKAFEHSKMGTEVIKEYINLNPEAPKIQLKRFVEVIEKLGEDEVGELLNSILRSKVSRFFIKQMAKLPVKEQSKILKKLPDMSLLLDKYERLERSLREFRKLIRKHEEAEFKDEKEIHQMLTSDFWLLGIEYFDKRILSDITPEGQLTGDTKIGSRKHADFIIERIDGLDRCVIIELEEANDPIFRKDGTLSKGVYDGIHQAVDYYIEQRSRGYNSKGIAVIGSLGRRLNEQQKTKLRILKETFHNIEILTYDEIIEKADNTLRFWKQYKPFEKAEQSS